MGKISMKGFARTEIRADIIEYNVEFKAIKDSTADGVNAIKNDFNSFLGKLEDAGIDISNIQIKKTSIDDYRSYKDEDKDKIEVSSSIRFKTSFDMKLQNYILNTIKDNGYQVRINVDYAISKKDDYRKELLKEAIEDSKKKAELVAEIAGEIITGIDTTDPKLQIAYQSATIEEVRSIPQFLKKSYEISDKLRSPELELHESIEIVWISERRPEKI